VPCNPSGASPAHFSSMRDSMSVTQPAKRVLAMLRSDPNTVDGLAKSLELSPNAVRNQLRKLQASGFVKSTGRRATSSKPATIFAITPEGQAAFSIAYIPVLRELARSASLQLPQKAFDRLMGAAGEALASQFPSPPEKASERVRAVAEILDHLGGITVVRRNGRGFSIESEACPLSALTAYEAAGCKIIKGLVSAYVVLPTKICCRLKNNPQCCFMVGTRRRGV
jgi:predicted ArsR family transcriptional regulator